MFVVELLNELITPSQVEFYMKAAATWCFSVQRAAGGESISETECSSNVSAYVLTLLLLATPWAWTKVLIKLRGGKRKHLKCLC